MDWDKLRLFHAVAQAGSFTHAGDSLNRSQSAISRQIGALEAALNAPLFHRHARGLILTEQGELLYRTVRDVFSKLATVEAQVSESKERPKGHLRITTSVAFGSLWLAPRIRDFVDLYPEVTVELLLDDEELDLGMREADCAIRMHPPRQTDLVQRHLLSIHVHVFAAPHYLKKYGFPRSVEELDSHRLIVYGGDPKPPFPNVNWLLEAGRPEGDKRRASLCVNNFYAMVRAAEAGLGIAAIPDYMAHESTKVVQILPDAVGPTYEAYFTYLEELRSSKRIAVFRDFLIRKVAETAF